MLAAKNFHAVEIDVLAGASAGGLNCVLFASAMRAGRSAECLLQTWLDAGSISDLMRPAGRGPIQSPLQGDAYFFPKVRDALKELYSEPAHPGLLASRVSVDLSATVINAQDARNASMREGQAGFHFESHSDHIAQTPTSGNEIPLGNSSPGFDESIGRLALAARSTSSFPGAFEPATVWSLAGDPGILPSQIDIDRASLVGIDATDVDMSEAFMLHRTSVMHGPYRVIDGGVFDNIPIARAFRAIRSKPATVPVRRKLIYLDPSPPPPPTTPPTRASIDGDFITVIVKALVSKIRGETASEDEDEIRLRQAERWIGDGRQQSYAAVLDLPGGSPVEQNFANSSARERAYARGRVSRDVTRLARIARDAEAWQTAESVVPRKRWARSEKEIREWLSALEGKFVLFANTETAQTVIDDVRWQRLSRDAGAALDAAAWLLAFIQWVELTSSEAEGPPSDRPINRENARGSLYGAISSAEATIRLQTVEVLIAAFNGTSAARVADMWWKPASGSWDMIASAIEQLSPILTDWDELPEPADATPDPGTDGTGPIPARRWWIEAHWRHLVPILEGDDASYAIAPLMAALGDAPLVEEPSYLVLNADWTLDQPGGTHPLHSALASMRRQQVLVVAQAILRDSGGEERATQLARELGTSTIPARSILAGTQLHNFGGFLSRDWRQGDWWWGRVAAAAFVGELLEQPGESLGLAELTANHRSETPALPQPTAGSAGAEPPSSGHFTMNLGGLHRLSSEYLYGVTTRLSRLLARSSTSVNSAGGRVAIKVMLGTLSPLLVFLPTIAQPWRFVTALAALLTGLSLTQSAVQLGRESAPPWWSPYGWIELAILCVMPSILVTLSLVSGALRSRKRWRILSNVMFPTHLTQDSLKALKQRSARRSYALAFAAFASLVACAIAWTSGATSLEVVWALIALCFSVAAARIRIRIRDDSVAVHDTRPDWHRIARLALGILAISLLGQFLVTIFYRPGTVVGAQTASILQTSASWTVIGLFMSGWILSGHLGHGWRRWAGSVIASGGAAIVLAISFGYGYERLWVPWAWVGAILLWGNALWSWLSSTTRLGSAQMDDSVSMPGS